MSDDLTLDAPTKDDNSEAPYGVNDEGVKLDKDGNPAPHGLKKDGTAAKKRGRQTGSTVSGSKKRAKSKEPTYAEGLNQLVQLLSAVPYAAGMATGNDALLADSWSIQNHGPNIANAIADMAETDERIARVCDKITRSTPYAALTAAVIPLIAQIAVNHNAMPVGFLGTHDPAQIVYHMKESANGATSSNGQSEQAA